ALESIKMSEELLADLPTGKWQGALPAELPAGEGSGMVETPRGALRYHVQSEGHRLSEGQIDAPRQLARLLARALLVGALVDDVPLIVQSLDVCTACGEH